jgi:PAS domain S-box-containing protein
MLKNFQFFFEDSAIGSAILSPEGKFVRINKSLTNILGYSELDFLKMDIQSITHIDGLSEENQYMQQMLDGVIKTHQLETRLKGKNGDLIWVLLTLTLTREEDTRPSFFIMQIKDIRRRVNSMTALKEMHERYDLAVGASSVGLWDWNVVTNELFWSDRFKEIVGIKDDDFMPHLSEFEDRLHPDDHDRIIKALIDHTTLKTPYNVEYKLRHEDGHYVWIHACGQAIWNDKGEPIRVAGSVDDITAKKMVELELQHQYDLLKQSNQDLDDFAYIASHDLKEPLRGLSNNATFLKEDYKDSLDEDAIKRIDRIIYLAERMEKLVNDLLHFAKLNKQEIDTKEVDLNNVIKDILSMMEIIFEKQNVKVIIPQKLPKIRCSEVEIAEVFRNLIVNAVKYNKNVEKIVEIGYEKKNGSYIFSIKDNGIGISPNNHEEIFRIFKRLNDEEEDVKGTGSGLTFVKKIIDRRGGNIWLESELGKGTTFYIIIN